MFIYSKQPVLMWPSETSLQKGIVRFVKNLRHMGRRKPHTPHASTLPPHLTRDAGIDPNRIQQHSPQAPFFFRDHPRL